jgi:hypothetical protein
MLLELLQVAEDRKLCLSHGRTAFAFLKDQVAQHLSACVQA